MLTDANDTRYFILDRKQPACQPLHPNLKFWIHPFQIQSLHLSKKRSIRTVKRRMGGGAQASNASHPVYIDLCFFCPISILLKDGQFDLLRNEARPTYYQSNRTLITSLQKTRLRTMINRKPENVSATICTNSKVTLTVNQ